MLSASGIIAAWGGVSIVVSPLIALMQDQVDALNQLGVRAAFLNSSLGMRTPRAPPYHTGLNVTERSENQRSFLRKEGVIIVATVAFGMGLDKPNVRFVAHLDCPAIIRNGGLPDATAYPQMHG